MNTRIQRIQFPENIRLLMISDIHGHASGLRALLQKANFNKQDVLVIVGDLLEKGEESLRLLRDVMAMCEEYTIYPLAGNVDVSRLRMLLSDDIAYQRQLLEASIKNKKWWPSSILEEMCTEIGVKMDESMDTTVVFPQLRDHFRKEIDFIQNLPVILETQRFIFVHGGIPHERLDELEKTNEASYLKRDEFLKEGLSFEKYVAVGHWPVALYNNDKPCHNPIIDRERHIICLDGGCGIKVDGQLNLLCLTDWHKDEFELYTWDGLPQIIALEKQTATENSCYIRWTRELPSVTVLEEKGEISRICYKGYKLDVPASFLWQKDGQCYCDDFTDYRLPVQVGDKLSVIFTHADGLSGQEKWRSWMVSGSLSKSINNA